MATITISGEILPLAEYYRTYNIRAREYQQRRNVMTTIMLKDLNITRAIILGTLGVSTVTPIKPNPGEPLV